ncbi:MAG: metallophosphoesterase family protein [Bacteroidales bacterium]|nr:metallophosphoesterase family protein [Bacteroidales bacterium]
MKKIGLLSDTHTYFDEKIYEFFNDCDEIWHAGDFGNIDVVNKLMEFKTLKGVYGNVDGTEIRKYFPQHLRFFCEEVDVWLTHIGGYPGNYSEYVKPEIFNNTPKLFISGHSHILKVMNDNKLNLLHINPGAAGKSGFQNVRTMVRFIIDNKTIKELEVFEIKI